MTDNYITHAYKRNSNNPAWAGRYFVVTSNLTFEEWLEACGIRTRDRYNQPSEHMKAMTSRFFVARLKADASGVNHLALKSPSTRGSVDEQWEVEVLRRKVEGGRERGESPRFEVAVNTRFGR